MIPPLFARVHIEEPPAKKLNLWIPLFVLWLLLLPFLLLLLPLILLGATIFLGPEKGFQALGLLYEMFCRLRGLDVDVVSSDSVVRIYFL